MFSLPHITVDRLIVFATAFVLGVFGIILHEVAHGFVASLQGDPTAKILGRLTLNPAKHIDPTGLIVFLITAILSTFSAAGGFIFGWAKPVPVNSRFFKNSRWGMMLVSFAGPLANLLFALVIAVGCRIIAEIMFPLARGSFMASVIPGLVYGISINTTLAIFNLLPIPPLDGSHIVEGLLPENLARKYISLGRYGFAILMLLIFTNVLGKIISPLSIACFNFIFALAGLS